MSVFKSLVDKVQAKKDELEKKAKRRAAEKAAEMALERGKEMAKDAVTQAGKALASAGATIEDALFGPEGEKAEAKDRAPDPREPPRRLQRDAEARAADEAKMQREVDEELLAMKRRLAKK